MISQSLAPSIKQTLRIQDYEVWVHLGCTADEQAFTQPVHFTVELHFNQNVLGGQTDQLTDAIDYVELMALIKAQAMKGPFHLIERLNELVFNNLYQFLKLQKVTGTLKVEIKKIRVPVENLRNGVVFKCEATL
ncbi:MAG: dihydroneopterin aldolase [Bdellovibrionaceae bacterium]|nr:dihydroneopterin aldolase [Bdellovibrio sp.]